MAVLTTFASSVEREGRSSNSTTATTMMVRRPSIGVKSLSSTHLRKLPHSNKYKNEKKINTLVYISTQKTKSETTTTTITKIKTYFSNNTNTKSKESKRLRNKEKKHTLTHTYIYNTSRKRRQKVGGGGGEQVKIKPIKIVF